MEEVACARAAGQGQHDVHTVCASAGVHWCASSRVVSDFAATSTLGNHAYANASFSESLDLIANRLTTAMGVRK